MTSTGGVGLFKKEWADAIAKSAEVSICFDRDEAGRMGAWKLARLLPKVKIALLPDEVGAGGDVTDFFVRLGRTADDFQALLASAQTLEEMQNEQSLLCAEIADAIHPSQEVLEDWACFAVPLLVSDSSRDAKRPSPKLMLVTSQGRLIDATDREALYANHKLVLTDTPRVLNPEVRWDPRHIREFCRGFSADPQDAFACVRDVYQRHIEFPEEEWYTVVPLWVMGTYLFRIFDAYPYLALTGVKNTGKSKTLELTSRLAFNGVNSVGISEASLFRLVASSRCTLCIDEAELLQGRGPKAQGIREIVNAGHRKGTSVYRQSKDRQGEFVTRRFEVYSPKALASIRGLEDVLASRAITIVMLRAKTERGRSSLSEATEDWLRIRHLLYSFALRSFGRVREVHHSDPDVGVANNRAHDLWSPLLALGKIVFADSPERFKRLQSFALDRVGEGRDENLDEVSTALLYALRELVTEDRMYANREIPEKALSVLADAGRDKVPSSAIGYRLQRFGIKKRRANDGARYWITREKVEDLSDRHPPARSDLMPAEAPAPVGATSVPTPPLPSNQ